MANYAVAAARHYQDAKLLNANGRYPSADHLAGFAVECALKAILLGFLGAQLGSRPFPVSVVAGKQIEHRHLPRLWDDVALCAARRTAPRFMSLIGTLNPFLSWDVSDRYEDCAHITAARAQVHLSAAAQILAVHQRAVIDGVLP